MSLLLMGLALAQGDGQVHIRGQVRHSGSGPIRVEVLQVQAEGPVLLLAESILTRPNTPFDIPVPPNSGRVMVRAAADPEMDGVGESDPQVVYPSEIEVKRADIGGIELNLVLMEQR